MKKIKLFSLLGDWIIMDFATIGGLVIGIGAVIVSFLMEGGHLSAILQAPAMIIVIAGTIGASFITTSVKTIMRIPSYLKLALFGSNNNPLSIIAMIIKMSEKARMEGILGLENDMKYIRDPFFRKSIQLVIDGTEVTVLKSILETEIAYVEERHKKGIALFQKLGGFSPTLGI
ncbi:MAG: motility protein A, partial [candidate division Zixibacteria bacterium]|nr:motility protein A [candidate division Zixibacteria bacterium]